MQPAEENPIGEATRLLDLALQAGAWEAEVICISGRSLSVELRKDRVELAGENLFCGLGLRAILRGAVGFSSTSDFDKLDLVAKSAVRAAKARVSDEEWRSLPGKLPIESPVDIFDPAIEGIILEECIDFATMLLDGCASVPDAEPLSGGVSCGSFCEMILNSRGVAISQKGTSFYASLSAKAGIDGSDVATGHEFDNSRQLCIKFEDIGKSAAEMARSSLGGSRSETGETDVLLRPSAIAELLEYAFVPSICADNVQKGRSQLANRLGETIGEENLKILDDGMLTGGMGTAAFDGEGVPSKRNTLVDCGVLRGFLHDSYTAGKSGVNSTGNAVRADYSEVPRVGIRNLIISSMEPLDLISETRRGVLVNDIIGAHTANPVSGDFSVEGRNAFQVVDGEVRKPLKSLMLAGNIFDILKSIEVGTDPRAVGCIVTPTVMVRMKVVGG
jgi:PmbA protein